MMKKLGGFDRHKKAWRFWFRYSAGRSSVVLAASRVTEDGITLFYFS